MTHSPSASSGPRLPFAFAGQATVSDPIQRHLEIGRSPVGWMASACRWIAWRRDFG